jgi:glucuronate isomerase
VSGPQHSAASAEVSPRDPDRLLPLDPETRRVARNLYDRVAASPIISPHGHVPVRLLLDNLPFGDPAELFLNGDHYVGRLLHANGVPLERIVGPDAERLDPRTRWSEFARNWPKFAGTASGYWIEESLSSVFGVDIPLDAVTADRVFDQLASQITLPAMLPRALFDRFGISVLATTDSPLDELNEHEELARADLGGRVLPTFRPDEFIDPDAQEFSTNVLRLLEVTGQPTTFSGYLEALRDRRAHFIRHGAVSTDHGVVEAYTTDLDRATAEALLQSALNGSSSPAERRELRGHMLYQMARMSVDDGLVMTVHAGIVRDHNSQVRERFGPGAGHDIPVSTEFTRGLRPLLQSFGLRPDFHLVLFTVDETAFSREIAPLAGFYPSVFVGAPWWFLDAPDAMGRFRNAVTETAGFYRGTGFIDDTRAFLSIPARHDTARRTDASYLARLVREGRIRISAAERIADDLVSTIPRAAFKL